MADKKRPLLSWRAGDYKECGIEAPDSLEVNVGKTEGELMTEEEVSEWCTDTIKTFSVIRQTNPDLFDDLYDSYIKDIAYLEKLGKLTEEQAEGLTKKENFEF